MRDTAESCKGKAPPEESGEPVFYGTADVAKMLKCSVPTAREIMRRTDFPLLKVGGKWRVLKTALIEWASKKRI